MSGKFHDCKAWTADCADCQAEDEAQRREDQAAYAARGAPSAVEQNVVGLMAAIEAAVRVAKAKRRGGVS